MVVPKGPDPVNSKMKGRKAAGSLLALGTAAAVSLYTIGYVHTQSSIDDLTATLPTVATAVPTQTATTSILVSAPTQPSPDPVSVSTATQAPTSTPAASSTATATPLKTLQKYADGTYTGTGTSRHGNITATVVVSGGKITSASVSNCATRYPCSQVNSLVSSAVANQAVPTSNVSGATDSSNAYKTAVSQALQKALVSA